MNYKDISKMLKKDGWKHNSTKGSHKHFKHPKKKGKVTVPDHGKKKLPPKTVESILEQAGLE